MTETTEVFRGVSQWTDIFHRMRRPESFWDGLTAETKEQCVDRQSSRKLCDTVAFDAAGVMKDKWNDELYPEVKRMLNQRTAKVFGRAMTQLPYAIQLYMMQYETQLLPSFVAVCYKIEVAQRIVKLVKQCLREQNIGLKYYAFRSLLTTSGGLDAGSPALNYCGKRIRIDGPGKQMVYCTLGGCILLDDTPYGLTVAHPMSTTTEHIEQMSLGFAVKAKEELVHMSASEDGSEDDSVLDDSDTSDGADECEPIILATKPDLRNYTWDFVAPVPNHSRMSVSKLEGNVSTQINPEDDWLLVALDNRGFQARNVDGRGHVPTVVDPSVAELSENRKAYVWLRSDISPIETFLPPTRGGLYIVSSSSVVDVWPCDFQTSELPCCIEIFVNRYRARR